MSINDIFTGEETAITALRRLYNQYGYQPYKMNKFEEYDLYAHNKSFLISDSIITFTDTSGKLLALKPDVTLSIVKHAEDRNCVTKLYYNENVYRVSGGSRSFREIPQTGLECIGLLDNCQVCEVLSLADSSLKLISPDSILDISHMGFITGLLDCLTINNERKKQLMDCIGEKNTDAMCSLAAAWDLDSSLIRDLCLVTKLYGQPQEVLPRLSALCRSAKMENAVRELTDITAGIADTSSLRLDFSMIQDLNYYSGIVFKGYIPGIPSAVLSGGRYDDLLRKFGKNSGAIGFAVYLDALERLESSVVRYDTDTVLLYDSSSSPKEVSDAANRLRKSGQSVQIQQNRDIKIRCKSVLRLYGKELIPVE